MLGSTLLQSNRAAKKGSDSLAYLWWHDGIPLHNQAVNQPLSKQDALRGKARLELRSCTRIFTIQNVTGGNSSISFHVQLDCFPVSHFKVHSRS